MDVDRTTPLFSRYHSHACEMMEMERSTSNFAQESKLQYVSGLGVCSPFLVVTD